MIKKKPTLEIEQTVYVVTLGFLSGDEPKEPKPYVVKKINTTSIMVGGPNSGMDMRFEKKTWTSRSLLGDTSYIWLSAEEYWASIKEKEDSMKMRLLIGRELEKLPLQKLQEVSDMLGIKVHEDGKFNG